MRHSKNRGFTLLETVIALAALATLSAAVIGVYTQTSSKANVLVGKMESVGSALHRVKLDASCYPLQLSGLVTPDAQTFCGTPKPGTMRGGYYKANSVNQQNGNIRLDDIAPGSEMQFFRNAVQMPGGTVQTQWLLAANNLPEDVLANLKDKCGTNSAARCFVDVPRKTFFYMVDATGNTSYVALTASSVSAISVGAGGPVGPAAGPGSVGFGTPIVPVGPMGPVGPGGFAPAPGNPAGPGGMGGVTCANGQIMTPQGQCPVPPPSPPAPVPPPVVVPPAPVPAPVPVVPPPPPAPVPVSPPVVVPPPAPVPPPVVVVPPPPPDPVPPPVVPPAPPTCANGAPNYPVCSLGPAPVACVDNSTMPPPDPVWPVVPPASAPDGFCGYSASGEQLYPVNGFIFGGYLCIDGFQQRVYFGSDGFCTANFSPMVASYTQMFGPDNYDSILANYKALYP